MTPFAEKHYPTILAPQELDAYLDKGWYRMGQSIFTTHYLCFDNQIYSALWTRLTLPGFSFTKSQRKLIRKNAKQFDITFQKANIDLEKELLYTRYKREFKGILAPTLGDSLMDSESNNVFNSMELQIRHEGKLIGFSVFDIGEKTAASIIGVYDPKYHKHSLGYYTMLLEMMYCMEQNFDYYYPGYVVPGYDRFDYKVRIGPVDFLEMDSKIWKPYSCLHSDRIPVNQMQSELQKAHTHFHTLGITSRLWNYPLFEANLFGFWAAPYLDYPFFLIVRNTTAEPEKYLLIVFNVRTQCFELLICAPFDDIQFYFNDSYTFRFDTDTFFMKLIIVEEVLYQTKQLTELSECIISLNS